MDEVCQTTTGNKILRSLSPAAFAMLAPSLEPVSLPRRMRLAERDRPCDWVFFPSSGIASVIAQTGTMAQEMGVFGHEGAGCATIVLGARRASNMIIMQVPGTGHRIPSSVVAAAFHDSREVRDAFLAYVMAMMRQVTQTALANTHLNTSQRLARWLLMIHDRVEGDDINLTHDYLSLMLGVARPGVTIALQSLERKEMIITARGQVTVTDRQALAALTGGLYTGLETRLLPWHEPRREASHQGAIESAVR